MSSYNLLKIINYEDDPNIQLWHSKNYIQTNYWLKNGGDPNYSNCNIENCTCLMSAKDSEQIKLLIEAGADVNRLNNIGQNALFFVNNVDQAKILIEAGINIDIIDNHGRTPLFSTITNNIELMIFFIKVCKLNVNHITKYGRNILFYAVNENQTKFLLEAGADYNQVDNYDMPVLFFANNASQTKLLIDAGANVNHIEKYYRRNALFYAKNYDQAKNLIDAGADQNLFDIFGLNPIFKKN